MICTVEKIFKNEKVVDDICKLSIKGRFEGKPGQFYMLKISGEDTILPRPISIHNINEEGIEFLYMVTGKGTKLMSNLKYGDDIQIIGPLGNGFDVEKIKGKVAVVSGGIGIAPLGYLVQKLTDCNIDFYAGFKNVDYSVDNVEKNVSRFKLSTENGSKGHKGYITDILNPEDYDMVICCGPKVMMDKVVSMCREANVPVLVSMENRMACGIGACLVCTCKTVRGNERTCKDGPVYWGEDLILDA